MDEIADMVEAEVWSVSRREEGNSVLLRLKGIELIVPLFMDDIEIRAVIRAQGEPERERPYIHDVLAEFIHRGGFELVRGELYELRDDLCRARLILAGGEYPRTAPLVLETLPADLFALILRTRRPLWVSQKLIDEAGIPEQVLREELGE